MQADTSLDLGNRNFVKAGYGNYSTPYLDAGFSFGDGKKNLFGLYGSYISSKGNIINQQYALFNVKGNAALFTEKNQINIGAAVSQNNYSLYGYDHNIYNFSKAEVQQKYQDIKFNVSLANTAENEYGISYQPSVEADLFTNKNKLNENTLVITAPIQKKIQESFIVKVEAKADVTTYRSKGLLPNSIKNNIFQFSPGVDFSSGRYTLHAGISPTWNNNTFTLLPDIYGELFVQEKIFLIQAGLVGKYTKNTFKNLSAVNPYLQVLSNQINTTETELYAGLKATLGKHFNFSAKAGFIDYDNFALFINDTATDAKSFKVVHEAKANNLRIHANASYVSQEQFTVTAGLTLNGYTGFDDNAKAWNTIPVEFTGSLRWWVSDQLLVKSDLYIFGGSNYIKKNNAAGKTRGGSDLSIGGEFSLNKMFSFWADINNIFSNKYQRWPNYPVYGLNMLAGIRVVF